MQRLELHHLAVAVQAGSNLQQGSSPECSHSPVTHVCLLDWHRKPTLRVSILRGGSVCNNPYLEGLLFRV